jgi:peptide-methionine (S)-S-oxide reductase
MVLVLFNNAVSAELAVFAGGCFWCTQSDLSKIAGVTKTIAGFDGGSIKNPSYQLVASGKTNFVESVQVHFNPKKISYQALVAAFLKTIDPTQKNGQFCDKGRQYRSVIFYLNNEQKQIASDALKTLSKQIQPIETELLASTQFYKAEAYHQHYAKKNPVRYHYYRWRCGRDARLKELKENAEHGID